MAIYFEADYSNCKEEFNDVTMRGELLEDFMKQTGIQLAPLPTVTTEVIDKILSNPLLLYDSQNDIPIQAIHEDILWKNMSVDERIDKFKTYVEKIDGVGADFIITDPYLFPQKYDDDYEKFLTSVIKNITPKQLTIVTVSSHVDETLQTSVIKQIGCKVVLKYSDDFHDRFWIARESLKAFVAGTSMNGIGKKISSLQLLDIDADEIKKLIQQIDSIASVDLN